MKLWMSVDEYQKVHDAGAAAYESAVPPDERYSAVALRKAVDAAICAIEHPDYPDDDRFAEMFEAGWNSFKRLREASPKFTDEYVVMCIIQDALRAPRAKPSVAA